MHITYLPKISTHKICTKDFFMNMGLKKNVRNVSQNAKLVTPNLEIDSRFFRFLDLTLIFHMRQAKAKSLAADLATWSWSEHHVHQLECPRNLGSMVSKWVKTYIYMGYILGYNPFANHLLTSWDIQEDVGKNSRYWFEQWSKPWVFCCI